MKAWMCSFVVLLACGGGDGDGGSSDINLDARCSLSGEEYDAFYEAGGPPCDDPNSDSEGIECYPGDTCSGVATCTFVSSPESSPEISCGLLAVSYDAFYEAGGPRCDDPNSDSEGIECFRGDTCSGPAQCKSILSAGGEAPTELFGRVYDAFYEAGGPRCDDPNSDSEGMECYPGDTCSGAAQCKIALSSKGGSVDTSKFGQVYDAFYEAGGPRCDDPNSDSEGLECFQGDTCSGAAQCEIVSSARR